MGDTYIWDLDRDWSSGRYLLIGALWHRPKIGIFLILVEYSSKKLCQWVLIKQWHLIHKRNIGTYRFYTDSHPVSTFVNLFTESLDRNQLSLISESLRDYPQEMFELESHIFHHKFRRNDQIKLLFAYTLFGLREFMIIRARTLHDCHFVLLKIKFKKNIFTFYFLAAFVLFSNAWNLFNLSPYITFSLSSIIL